MLLFVFFRCRFSEDREFCVESHRHHINQLHSLIHTEISATEVLSPQLLEAHLKLCAIVLSQQAQILVPCWNTCDNCTVI